MNQSINNMFIDILALFMRINLLEWLTGTGIAHRLLHVVDTSVRQCYGTT